MFKIEGNITKIVSIILALCFLLLFYNNKDSEKNDILADDYPELQPTTYIKIEKTNKLVIDDLKIKLQNYINEHNLNDQISIYVTSLNDEELSCSYLENKEFFAASIFKLPLAMIYYEKINKGIYKYTDGFKIKEEHFEGAYNDGSLYKVGDDVSLKTLLDNTIIYSDNIAANVLYHNLGGWGDFKRASFVYSDNIDLNNPSLSNVVTALYLSDVLTYLYNNQDKFEPLLINMKLDVYGQYLSKYVDADIMQKYGRLNEYSNSVGLVNAKTPYAIAVLTSLDAAGIDHIGRINEICFNFFNES